MLPDEASLLHPMWHSSTEFPQVWPSWSKALLERVDAIGVTWSMALLEQAYDCGEDDTNI